MNCLLNVRFVIRCFTKKKPRKNSNVLIVTRNHPLLQRKENWQTCFLRESTIRQKTMPHIGPCQNEIVHIIVLSPRKKNSMPATPTYSSVPPLKGLREPRAASVSYRASVPAGHAYCEVAPSHRALSPAADRQNRSFKALSGKGSAPAPPPPFRHTPCHPWLQPTTTVWRNLLRNPLLCLQPTTSVWRNLQQNAPCLV